MQCPKCDGSGYIECYAHVARGVCFSCNGRGWVNGKGQAVKPVRTTQLRHTLFGLSRRDTKLVIDLTLTSGCVSSDDDKAVADLERMVDLGHMVRRASGKQTVYEPAQWFTSQSINVLVDWSK